MTHDPNQPAPGQPPGEAPDVSPALNVGDVIGRYRIVSQLAADAASAVWRATDGQAGGEYVIRQLIPGTPAARDRVFLSRCQKEIDRQRALDGKVRRVVLLRELLDDPRGAFVVTDYVSGATIEQLLGSRPDPFDLVRGLRIVHAVAKVLEQVHGQGLIHGGLRPSNIILRLNGGVQVCDLGVTGLVAEHEALSPRSARYLAPELFHGVAGDAQSDIYSLGMVTYEMLAGRGAFDRVFSAVLSDPRGPAIRWMKWHTNARVAAPLLHEINPRVPVRLSDLVARMMAKDRTKRIASAEQLLHAIQRHFGNEAIEQAEVSPDTFTPSGAQISATGPGDTTELPAARLMPRVLTAAAIVLALLVAGVWFTVSTMNSRSYSRQRAQAVQVLADADAQYTQGKFEEALTTYQSQAKRWPDPADALNRHGRAGALLVKAQLALSVGDYDTVQAQVEALDQLGEAGPANRNAVKGLADEVARRRAFLDAVASINAHLEKSAYAQARAQIQEARRGELTVQESQALLDLQVQIDARLNADRVEQAIIKANQLAEAGNLPAAIKHLEAARSRLSSPRIDGLMDSLSLKMRFEDAIERGESAEQSNDHGAAIRAFNEALSLREDSALSQRVSRLRSKVLVDEGKAKAEAEDQQGARQAFMSALSYDPGNAQARGWLTRMDVRIERRSLLTAALRAEAAGDLVQAAGHYRAALKQGEDEELEATLRGLDTRIALIRAEQYMASGQLDRAETQLLVARDLEPDNPAVTDALSRYDRHARYHELIVLGDDHAEHGRFAQAKQAYRRARDIFQSEQVNQRLDDTEFNHLMAQARGYIDNYQWASARSILDTAARIRVTDGLTRLRERVNEGMGGSTGTNDE